MKITIETNHHWREPLSGLELTEKELQDFDYLEEPEFGNFVRYRGRLYDLGEFVVIGNFAPEELKAWHGYTNDTTFSGILVRYSDDCEQFQIATFYS